jgi:putative copper export protein
LIAVVAVAVSGVVQTVLFLPTFADLFDSAYGLATLAKVAGFLILIAFGAFHRFRAIPALQAAGSSRHLRASVRRETMVMVTVVLLGGLLAYLPPPSHPAVASLPSSTP